DDPQHEHRVVWDLARAKHAGLMNRKGPWQSYPAAMLRSRAVSEACRIACPEVLGAVKYTPDELGGDFVDTPEGAPAAFAAPGPTTKVSRKKKEPEPTEAEVIPEPPASEPDETGEAPS